VCAVININLSGFIKAGASVLLEEHVCVCVYIYTHTHTLINTLLITFLAYCSVLFVWWCCLFFYISGIGRIKTRNTLCILYFERVWKSGNWWFI